MKKSLFVLASLALLPAGAALADDDDCRVPRDQWQPQEAVMRVIEANGWTLRDLEVDDGCYEVEARDKDGRKVEVTLDPASLRILEIDRDDDDRRRKGRSAAPQVQLE